MPDSAKKIERLHYLTQDMPGRSHAEQAELACIGGVRWVQFRSKLLAGDKLKQAAGDVKKITDLHGATLIINDHVDLALQLGCGVHLGQQNMPVSEARKILGDNAIIGGTANTAEHIRKLVKDGADYIGLGPYRFTTTKENLSPILDRHMLQTLLALQDEIPIVLIGGITADDIDDTIEIGAYGVAVSAAINMATDPAVAARGFIKKIIRKEEWVS